MKIRVINTGGTFNKAYNTITGELEVQKNHRALNPILEHFHTIEFEIKDIIGKDSLDFTLEDRQLLLHTINSVENSAVIVIHGTDTMSETAQFLEQNGCSQKVILTGAMTPVSIDAIEGIMNFSSAVGALNMHIKEGIYIAMHGVVSPHDRIYKDKQQGLFFSR